MRISDWSSDVCSSDLQRSRLGLGKSPCTGEAAFWRFCQTCDALPPLDSPRNLCGSEGRIIPHRFCFEPEWIYRRYTIRSEEHTSELQSLMRISYAVFCLEKKTQ